MQGHSDKVIGGKTKYALKAKEAGKNFPALARLKIMKTNQDVNIDFHCPLQRDH